MFGVLSRERKGKSHPAQFEFMRTNLFLFSFLFSGKTPENHEMKIKEQAYRQSKFPKKKEIYTHPKVKTLAKCKREKEQLYILLKNIHTRLQN